jgi:hypothetical protein
MEMGLAIIALDKHDRQPVLCPWLLGSELRLWPLQGVVQHGSVRIGSGVDSHLEQGVSAGILCPKESRVKRIYGTSMGGSNECHTYEDKE